MEGYILLVANDHGSGLGGSFFINGCNTAILCLNVLSAFLENEHHLAEPEEMGLPMQLWCRLGRRKALWWVLRRTSRTGCPAYLAFLLSRLDHNFHLYLLPDTSPREREEKGVGLPSSAACRHKPGYSSYYYCSGNCRWKSKGWKVSGSGKVKIAPVSNCSAQKDNREGQIVFIWKMGGWEMTAVWEV